MAWKVWQNWTSLMTQPVNSCLAGCDLTTQVNKLKRKRILTNPHQQTWAFIIALLIWATPLREWKFPLRCRWPPCLSLSPPTTFDMPSMVVVRTFRPLCAPCQLGVSFHPGPPPNPPDSPSQHQSLQSHASTEMGAATHHLRERNSYYKGQDKNQINSACKGG